MSTNQPLTEKAREKRKNAESELKEIFTKEILDAMRLADQFSSVEPEPYILPLDALAGFPATNQFQKE